MERLDRRSLRRLALCRAGLLKPEWTGLPDARGRPGDARGKAAHAMIDRFGYLQLDTVSIAGARSHAIVLLSRLEGLDPALGESLLRPGEPLFEYWGHEASWMPMDLYPVFEFRRREFRACIPGGATSLLAIGRWRIGCVRRIRDEGPLRSLGHGGEGQQRLVGSQGRQEGRPGAVVERRTRDQRTHATSRGPTIWPNG